MADTSIEWTDATWNPVAGCTVLSPGCTNCYAMKLAGTRLRKHDSRVGLTTMTKAGPVWNGTVRFNTLWLDQPLRWQRARRIFVCAHGDLFHELVPDEWLDKVFAVMALCPQHTFQVLTKRSARMRAYLTTPGRHTAILAAAAEVSQRTIAVGRPPAPVWPWPLPNAWLGVSGENQHWLLQRGCDLVETPAAVRFFSLEPLLDEIDAEPFLFSVRRWSNGWLNNYPFHYPKQHIDWMIVGGESGSGARPLHPDWVRKLRDQCFVAGVPFFFKQWGEYRPCSERELKQASGATFVGDRSAGAFMMRVGKKAAGRLLDGIEHNGMPSDA